MDEWYRDGQKFVKYLHKQKAVAIYEWRWKNLRDAYKNRIVYYVMFKLLFSTRSE